MSEWQPIETAPKDGTPILAVTSYRERPFIANWEHVGRYTSSPKMWVGHPYGAVADGDMLAWMPIPEGPVDS